MKLNIVGIVSLFLFIIAVIPFFMPFWTIKQETYLDSFDITFTETTTLFGYQIWSLHVFRFLLFLSLIFLRTKEINTSQICAIIGCAAFVLHVMIGFIPGYAIIELYIGFYISIIPIIGIFFLNALVIPKLKAKETKEIRRIANSIDVKIIIEIEEKIKLGEQSREKGNLDEAVNNFIAQLERTISISDYSKRIIIRKKIEEALLKIKIIKLKKIIVDLSYKYPRLGVIDIVEKCGEDEELIISTIQDMIKNREISAEYFKGSKTIAFSQQIDVEEIDELMKSFEDWEKEGKGKKI